MKNIYLILAFYAGLSFGAWPLLMNRSNLTGFLSAAVFVSISLVVIVPFTWYGGVQSLYAADWKYAILAGVVGSLGLLAFTSMLANSTPQTVGPLFIITLLTQVVVAAVYDAHMNGSFPKERIIGLVAAVIAVIFLRI